MGGLQIQITFTSTEELCDAEAKPDEHRDLMVRIAGRSARFVDMSKSGRKEIIRKKELVG